MKKFAIALLWVAIITFWLSMILASVNKPPIGQYSMVVFNDGEIIIFNSATGQPRVVRGPQADHVPGKPSEEITPQHEPDVNKGERSF